MSYLPYLFPCHSITSPAIHALRSKAASSNSVLSFFADCPDNAFQKVQPGMPAFTVKQRCGAIVRNGAKLMAVGFCASMLGGLGSKAVHCSLAIADVRGSMMRGTAALNMACSALQVWVSPMLSVYCGRRWTRHGRRPMLRKISLLPALSTGYTWQSRVIFDTSSLQVRD